MTVESIKEATAGLPPDEKASLAAWLVRQDMDDWSEQIEADFGSGGAGMALLEEAHADVLDGLVKPMDEFWAEARVRRASSPRR